MSLDKIYVLQTGVSLKVSTIALQELIANAAGTQKISELENIRSTTDLYHHLSVVVDKGAEGLIKRRQPWVDRQIKSDLIAGQPIPFNSFCRLFWRNLDEEDQDGDEWLKLMASDQFYTQMTILLNKVRAIARSLQHKEEMISHLSLGVCRT